MRILIVDVCCKKICTHLLRILQLHLRRTLVRFVLYAATAVVYVAPLRGAQNLLFIVPRVAPGGYKQVAPTEQYSRLR